MERLSGVNLATPVYGDKPRSKMNDGEKVGNMNMD